MNTSIKMMLAAACLVIALAACGKKNGGSEAADNGAVAQVMMVDDLLSAGEGMANDTVVFEGVCTHICKHGGRKIFVMGSDNTQTLRVEGAEMGKFDARCVNNVVRVTGILREQRIDEGYLADWEARVANQTDEQHGSSAAGCDTEKQARQETGNSASERIADFRRRIAERQAADGKAYLSFFYVDALSYEIVE